MRPYLVGVLIGTTLSFGAAVYADVTAKHYAAVATEDIQKCVADSANGKTQVSFNLSPDGIDYSSAMCWPEGIK